MPRVTIYIDAETERRMRSGAKAEGVSLSEWIGRLVRSKTRKNWPESVKSLAGAWKDFPSAEELRKNRRHDVPREQF